MTAQFAPVRVSPEVNRLLQLHSDTNLIYFQRLGCYREDHLVISDAVVSVGLTLPGVRNIHRNEAVEFLDYTRLERRYGYDCARAFVQPLFSAINQHDGWNGQFIRIYGEGKPRQWIAAVCVDPQAASSPVAIRRAL